MGAKCAGRFSEVAKEQKDSWRDEVINGCADTEEAQMLGTFAHLPEWKDKYENVQYQKSRLPNFVRRRIRQKMHDVMHDTLMCFALELISNMLAQLESQLLHTEAKAPTPPAILTSKIANALNGAALSFRFRRYGALKFDYLRELAVAQIAWQLSSVHTDTSAGIKEARHLVEQAIVPVLQNKLQTFQVMAIDSPAVVKLINSGSSGKMLVEMLQAHLRAEQDAIMSKLQAQISAVLDVSEMIKSIEDHREPGSEPYSREDMVLMLSERIDANINYSYEQLETTLSEHIQDFQDFMEGASSADVAEVPGTPEPSLAEAEADAKFDIEGSPPEAIGSLSPGERKGRHRRRSSLLRALEQSLTPTATGRIVAKTGDSPGTVSSSSVLQALEKFSPGAEEMLCNDIVASPLASSLRDSVSEMGSAGRAMVGMLRGSSEVPLSPVVSAGQTLKLEEQLEQLRKENQRLENCYKESARDLEEERRLNGSLQEQLQAAQVAAKEASSSKNDQALAGEPSKHLEAAQVSKGDQDHQGDPELNVCQSPEPEACHL